MEVKHKVNLVFTVAGIVLGYLSFLIGKVTYPSINILILIIVGYLLKTVLKKTWKIEEKGGWWSSNAWFFFVLFWLITWTIFYNLP